MADLVLYHAVPSRSATVRWMLEEVGEPYDVHLLKLSEGDQQKPDYLAINPQGKVPALKHKGVVFTEVAAICTYLADAFPNAKLAVPANDPRRGVYLQWLFFGPSCMEPAISRPRFPAQGCAARWRDRVSGHRHACRYRRQGGGKGALPDGRAVYRSRCRGRFGNTLGHHVQADSGARRLQTICRTDRGASGFATRGSQGQGAGRKVSYGPLILAASPN